jgi:hypothetical protein
MAIAQTGISAFAGETLFINPIPLFWKKSAIFAEIWHK